MVNGEIRKRNGQLVGHDVEMIRQKAKVGQQRIFDNLAKMRPDMTPEEISQYLVDADRSSRVNLAQAHAGRDARGDWMRQV
jgi:hypothetical protein